MSRCRFEPQNLSLRQYDQKPHSQSNRLLDAVDADAQKCQYFDRRGSAFT